MMPNSVYLTPREEKWPRMTFPNRKIPHESDEFIGSTILDTKAANDNVRNFRWLNHDSVRVLSEGRGNAIIRITS